MSAELSRRLGRIMIQPGIRDAVRELGIYEVGQQVEDAETFDDLSEEVQAIIEQGESFLATMQRSIDRANKGNPYHVASGEKGGQFTSGPTSGHAPIQGKEPREPRDHDKESAESSSKEFVPAKTVDDAEGWLKSHGIQPAWQTKDEEDYPYKITLDQINEVHSGLHPLFQEYPEVVPTITRLGHRYALDRNRWLDNLARNMNEDKEEYEKKGRRWREGEAEKRVRKTMVDEPTIEGNDGGEYSIFEGGAWVVGFPEPSRDMRFNHKSVVLSSLERSNINREAYLKREHPLGNVGDDYGSAAQHEFGHALDEKFQISNHQKFADLYGSLRKNDIESGLSTYAATNIKELLAEGFSEGLRDDSRPLGKKIKQLIDEIVAERRSS